MTSMRPLLLCLCGLLAAPLAHAEDAPADGKSGTVSAQPAAEDRSSLPAPLAARAFTLPTPRRPACPMASRSSWSRTTRCPWCGSTW